MATKQEKDAVCELLAKLRNPCIVDLGAFQGEDSAWMRDACMEAARNVMVEADVRNAQRIIDSNKLQSDRVSLIVGAVAATNGLTQFHMCETQRGQGIGSGSIRKPTGHLEAFDWCSFPRVTTVPCYTLDRIFEREWLARIDMLWVDIQGAERDMIAAGRCALAKARYLFMETEAAEMYEGQATKRELIAMLPGWELLQDFGENVLMRNREFCE